MPRVFTWRTVIVAAVAGAIVSVLVAWGCAMWAPVTRQAGPPGEAATPPAFEDMPDGERADLFWWAEGFGWVERKGAHRYASIYRFAGWPAPAVWSRTEIQPTGIPQTEDGEPRYESDRAALNDPNDPRMTPPKRWRLSRDEIWHRGLNTTDLPRWLHALPERRLPLVPLWSGLAVDTVCYGAAVLGLIAGPRFVRLRRRWTNRLCLRCGYGLAGHADHGQVVCPECGLRQVTRGPAQITLARQRARARRPLGGGR